MAGPCPLWAPEGQPPPPCPLPGVFCAPWLPSRPEGCNAVPTTTTTAEVGVPAALPDRLARTGAGTDTAAGIGLGLIIGGAVLAAMVRRRARRPICPHPGIYRGERCPRCGRVVS